MPLASLGNLYTKARAYALAHKGRSVLVAAVVLIVAYWGYGKLNAPSTVPKYVTTIVASSTVISTMAETGQVSATSNITLPSQASGAVTSVQVAPGQHVAAGATILTIDPTTALQSVANAKASLESAQINLAKLQEAADPVTLANDQNSVASAQANLATAHTDGYNDVSSAFLDFPGAMASLDSILHSTTVPGHTYEQNENAYSDLVVNIDSSVTSYETTAESAYQKAYASYQKTLADFNTTPRDATDAQIETIVSEANQTASNLSDALKATDNFLNFVDTTATNHQQNIPTVLTNALSTLTSSSAQTNTHAAALAGDAATFLSAQRSLDAANATLAKLQGGPDPLDIQSSQLSVQQQENSLAIAETNLANTVVRAPFAGIVAQISVQKYQNVGSGTAVATLVSDNQSANLSLNEVDAAKLSVGQKATLTFDALPDITISGTVSSVDALGTVSSGVVSYDAVITFDTDNASVKPGMSMTASIITGEASGLVVPSSAVKTSAGQQYVLVFNPALAGSDKGTAGVESTIAPTPTPVTTGLSSDTQVLITSGLSVGDDVVTRTITSGTQTTAAAAPSLFSAVGGRTTTGAAGARGASGAVRVGG